VRWWDYWLKGKQNGIMDEPRFEVFMRRFYPPDPNIKEIPGEWRAEKTWPPKNQRAQTFYFQSNHALGGAAPAATDASKHKLRYVPSVGSEAGFWWGDFTTDQRPIDAFSLVYDYAPLEKDLAILGWPKAILHVSATPPLADWFVRLSDVAPDGTVTMITGAGQSGAQRASAANPTDLEPGRQYELPFELHLTSWVFLSGHRIRLAISNALFPIIWPTPYPMTTSLFLGGGNGSRLELPIVPAESSARPHFPAIDPAPPFEEATSSEETWPPKNWSVTRDLMTSTTRAAWSGDDSGEFLWGKMKDHEEMTYVVEDDKPEASAVHADASTTVELPGRTLIWSVVLDLRSDAKNFYYHFERRLNENGKLICQKSWDEIIPRDHQ
jgi:uncharacterized protein